MPLIGGNENTVLSSLKYLCYSIHKTIHDFNMKFHDKKNIFQVSKFFFLISKYCGYFPFTVDFKSGRVTVELTDWIIFVISFVFSIVATLFVSKLSIRDSTKSVILESGIFILMKESLASMVLIKLFNFVMRWKIVGIFANIHWIDLKVKIKYNENLKG